MVRLILIAIMVFSMFAANAQTWSAAAAMSEPVRAGNTAGYSANGNGFLYVVSGRNANGLITKKNQRYNVNSNTWTDLADHPTGKLGSATTIVKDSLYLIGGLSTTPGVANRRVYKYSINENTWSLVAQMPNALTDAKAVTYQDSLIYVTGGYSGNTLLYNAHTDKWRMATPVLPGGSLSWGGFAIKNDTLVFVGGTDGFLSPNYFNTVRIGVIDQNDRANITWTEATPFPGATRTFFDMYEWKDGIILTGGSTDNTFETNSDECYHYNVGADLWTQLPSKPTSWNTGNSASVLVNGQWKLICAAGYAGTYLTETEIFSQSALRIKETPSEICGLKHFKILQSKNPILQFCLQKDSAVTVTIHDSHGRIVKTFVERAVIGNNQIGLKNHQLSKGLYFCTLKQDDATATKKLLIE